jgi:hypothetical protein
MEGREMIGCRVKDITIHSRENCYQFTPEQMQAIESKSASLRLEAGTNIIKIQKGLFNSHATPGSKGEPVVLLWIYGGKFANQKTNVEVEASWSTLNGYEDALVLQVSEPASLCAFFFDTDLEDNEGEIQLSIVRI